MSNLPSWAIIPVPVWEKVLEKLAAVVLVVSVVFLIGTVANANEPPSVPEGGMVMLYSSPCSDNETGEKGMCYIMQDQQGNVYVTFWQEETLMFIRQLVGDSYIVIWVNDLYMDI